MIGCSSGAISITESTTFLQNLLSPTRGESRLFFLVVAFSASSHGIYLGGIEYSVSEDEAAMTAIIAGYLGEENRRFF